MLGIVTGLVGRTSIAAATYAVEYVVLRHLEAQLAALRDQDIHAAAAIDRIVADETAHKDHYAALTASDRHWRRILQPLVAASTETMIWLGMRLRRPRWQ